VDPSEPVIRFPLVILRYLGVDFILILFGLFGAAISGAVPIVINLVLGNVVDGLTKSSAATKSKVVNAASAVRTLASFQTVVSRSGTYLHVHSLVHGCNTLQ